MRPVKKLEPSREPGTPPGTPIWWVLVRNNAYAMICVKAKLANEALLAGCKFLGVLPDQSISVNLEGESNWPEQGSVPRIIAPGKPFKPHIGSALKVLEQAMAGASPRRTALLRNVRALLTDGMLVAIDTTKKQSRAK